MVFDATHLLVWLLVQTLDEILSEPEKLGITAQLNEGKHS